MNILFMIFAFIGMFASGFFACMILVIAALLPDRSRKLKRKNKGGDLRVSKDERTEHRSRNVQ